VAAAYSVRPKPDARVSAPLTWQEIDDCNPADFTLESMPRRFGEIGDRHAGINEHPCSLDALLELSARDEKEGLGDAPWPPQYKKQPDEPTRVQPSRARKSAAGAAVKRASGTRKAHDWSDATEQDIAAWKSWDPVESSGVSRRVSKHPLIEIARADRKEDALAEVERWKARHPEVAAHLVPADILVDAMRGRSSTWTRVRVNLKNVPEALRPLPEKPVRVRKRS
jgi:bifunctional non-homologous end joining protein LigD